ncbi:type VII secretion-associated serine protease mycosin [Streptomyces sp. SAI-135]|uniref:S8 family serine peptidase n=1 Tax=unclassified Streptomyces TaxID=2593676 RepID=UPI00247674D3|nr:MULTISPECIES: S8 family serine peptidase [unclassified Streptomyces]MDH6516103.1 type VII secretion-associated serine protease mycosin [Streptomyces sp. SAI-090]MDH6619809.1 type VII secretion-associated serine protease mycosin [Streptomyces sp. SAI-135]
MAITRTVRALSAATLMGALILAAAPVASADQTRRDQWALTTLQSDSVWTISKGKGVTVAVIDTGVNAEHIDLQNNVLKGRDFVDGDDDASPEATDDQASHGTAMASLIAGHGHGPGSADGVMGLAPEAKILPIRADLASFADEIRYAVDQKASVINISMDITDQLYAAGGSPEDLEAISYALKHDVLIVAGSGNDGKYSVAFPARAPGVLAVGGVTKSGTVWGDSNYGPQVMLSAPATDIVHAAWPGNKLSIGDGTSDATAFVSASAALLRSKFPNLTAGQIANRLVKTAVLPHSVKQSSLPDEKYGYGTIRPLAALTDDIPAGSQYGPLKVPGAGSDSPSAAATANTPGMENSAEQEKADQKQMIFFIVLGVVALVVFGLIVLLIVKLSQRNRNKNDGTGGPPGHVQCGQQFAPPQQNPYQQPTAAQQNPYQQQPTPPPGQWPPQQ